MSLLDRHSSWLEFNDACEELLQNNLVLDRTRLNSGEGLYMWEFLCAEVEDKDFLWDTSEIDW